MSFSSFYRIILRDKYDLISHKRDVAEFRDLMLHRVFLQSFRRSHGRQSYAWKILTAVFSERDERVIIFTLAAGGGGWTEVTIYAADNSSTTGGEIEQRFATRSCAKAADCEKPHFTRKTASPPLSLLLLLFRGRSRNNGNGGRKKNDQTRRRAHSRRRSDANPFAKSRGISLAASKRDDRAASPHNSVLKHANTGHSIAFACWTTSTSKHNKRLQLEPYFANFWRDAASKVSHSDTRSL